MSPASAVTRTRSVADATVTVASVFSATSTCISKPLCFSPGSAGTSTLMVASSETTTEPAPASVNNDSVATPSSTFNSALSTHSTNTTSVRWDPRSSGAPRVIATTPSRPGITDWPSSAPPSAFVNVQFLVLLEIASNCLTPVPDPLNGSGNGASRTDSGVRSINPLPPVHASGSSV